MPPRYRTSPPRAGLLSRYNLTRRGLIGLGAIVAGAGVADLLHRPHHAAGTKALKGTNVADPSGISPPSSGAPSASTGAGSSSAAPTSSSGLPATPGLGGAPSTPPTLPHVDSSSGAAHPGPGGKKLTAKERRLADEHVTLPPTRVHVRTRPAFYVDEVMPDPPKKAIALTIDDGPSPEYTPKVLRLLDHYGQQASFCVVGAYVDMYPKLIRDIHRAGHTIVNHTYTHILPFTTQTERRIVDEITRTQRAVEKAAKTTPELFRSPGGDWSPFLFKAAAAYDLVPLDWDVDPDDWQLPGTKAITRRMLQGTPNDIVLCHDGGGDRIETVRALRKVLPAWRRRGYTTVALVPPSSDFPPPPPAITPTGSPSSSPDPASPSSSASTSPTP